MHYEQFLQWLSLEIKASGSQAKLAEKLGISRSYLSYVLERKLKPGKKLLDAMNAKRIEYYEVTIEERQQ
jgi:transcriptional regulator with XRE-family HTH domain